MNIARAAAVFSMIAWGWGAAAQDDCGAASKPCAIENGSYHLAMPETETITGIVMHLHGGGGRGRGVLNSGMARASLLRGYVFVAPNGEQPTRPWPRDWSVRGKGMTYDRDDSVFLPAVLADVRARYGLHDVPVMLSGFSRGGSMVWDIACQMPDFANGYAPLAGAFWDDLPTECAAPVRLLHTHGWNDRVVPLEGRSFRDGAVVQGDVWASLKILRETNGCRARQPERNSIEGDLWLRHWTDCDAGEIRLILHPGGHGAPQGWATRMLDWFEAKGS